MASMLLHSGVGDWVEVGFEGGRAAVPLHSDCLLIGAAGILKVVQPPVKKKT